MINIFDAMVTGLQQVYQSLTDEERAEVDAFNKQISGQPVTKIIEMCANHPGGRHPFAKYLDRARVEIDSPACDIVHVPRVQL